jgi:hypothetical protein
VSDAIPGSVHADGRPSALTFMRPSAGIRCASSIWLLIVLGSAAIGCGTSHATLEFSAPSSVVAGSPFTVRVTVMIDVHRDTMINSRIHFSSSDPAAVLPGDYYFSSADAGTHVWTNGFVLVTPGNQTISGEIIDATGINGMANVKVLPPSAETLIGWLRPPLRTSPSADKMGRSYAPNRYLAHAVGMINGI